MPERARDTLGAAIVLLATLVAPAFADGPSVQLVHERSPGAEGCPDETSFRAATIDRLHYDPFSDDGPRTVRVRVVPDDDLFVGEVRLEGVGGQVLAEKRLASTDCADLTDGIILAMAIALDPIPEPAAATAGPPAIAAGDPARLRAEARAAPSPADPLVWYAAMAGLAAVGVRPGVAPGVALEVGASRRRWGLAVDVRSFLPATVRVQGGTVTASSALSTLLACTRLSRLSLCAAVLGGALYSRGHDDLVRPRTSIIPQVGVGQRAAWDQPLSRRFALRLQLDGGGWLVRARLTVGRQDVWAEPAGWASAALTLVGRIP